MKTVTISYPYQTKMYSIRDDAVADAAYAAIKKAMATYKEYGNDRETTVSFDHGSGEATVRIGAVTEVTVTALGEEEEATIREVIAWKDRFKEIASNPA